MKSPSSKKARLFAFALFLTAALSTSIAESRQRAEPLLWEGRVGVGVKSLFGLGMFGYLPVPLSLSAKVDLGRYLRLHSEFDYHITGVFRSSVGAGSAFTVVGRHALPKLGFQMKLPILGELGFVSANRVEGGDGYADERIRLLILGLSSGLDFTWWFSQKAGLWTTLTGGYMFQFDVGSQYGFYSFVEGNVGIVEVTLLIGVAF